jgi:hypothetical protein
MIPTFEVIDHDPGWRAAELARVTFDNWQGGDFTASHGYSPLSQLPWEEVQGVIAEESQILSRLDGDSATPKQFEELAREADDNAWGDFGTAGLVCTLSAAGFWTFTSCRGHYGRLDWDVPFVGFIADRLHLEVLEPLILQAGSALLVRPDGLVEVCADRVTALHDLAALILEYRAAFHELGSVAFADD